MSDHVPVYKAKCGACLIIFWSHRFGEKHCPKCTASFDVWERGFSHEGT